MARRQLDAVNTLHVPVPNGWVAPDFEIPSNEREKEDAPEGSDVDEEAAVNKFENDFEDIISRGTKLVEDCGAFSRTALCRHLTA